MSGEFRIILLILGMIIILAVYFYSRFEKKKNGKSNHAQRTQHDDPVIRPPDTAPSNPDTLPDEGVGEVSPTSPSPDGSLDGSEQHVLEDPPADERGPVPTADIASVSDKRIDARASEAASPAPKAPAEPSVKALLGEKIGKLLHDLKSLGSVPTDTDNDEEEKDEASIGRILVLHICAPTDRAFHGSEILSAAEKVGLKCGNPDDAGAFERILIDEHGRRSVRFYVANMHEPGTFPWASLPEQRVRGLSVFARVSSGEDAVSLFDDMVCSARNMTALLEGGSLLDENRNTLTSQTINHISEQLRNDTFESSIEIE